MKVILSSQMRRELQTLVAQPVAWEVPLAAHTSLRIGGPAEALVTVEDCAELASVLSFARRQAVPWRLLGKGSNVLVADDGLAGITLMLGGGFRRLEKIGDREVAAGAASVLPALSRFCQENGLSGLEFAAGIPGSVGGAVVMNAGAFGGQIAAWVSALELCGEDGPRMLPASELRFAYRAWLDAEKWRGQVAITGVHFILRQDDPAAIAARMEEYQRARRLGQPHGATSAGSFFKNPPGDSAGRLIDTCGLKGLRVGDAMVSPAHANFLVNIGQATAADVRELARLVREAVHRRHGVDLEQEVEEW
ncbi:MAG: UDP-N-acetylmuramate dehydrogenase [Desulfobulbaceae bacterium]|jgi:UDP-N-acetylmuramate dehydrogenase|nr:UDP-N-acetylmuramate dehydrogenase [Desulfobulbaceae bacterium]